jgi:hypothetical protein
MFTLRRTTHIASLVATVATIYIFFHTEFDGEITFAFTLLFLLVAFNTSNIQK